MAQRVLAVFFLAAMCASAAEAETQADGAPSQSPVANRQSAMPGLAPSFPNHALVLTGPPAASRLNPGPAQDTELPFSWPQVVVVRENTTNNRLFGAFDPGFQQVLYEIVPREPVNMRVELFDSKTGLMQATALAKTGGLTEEFLFRVRARDVTNDEIFSLVYDIRIANSRVRNTPILQRSPGDFIKPGQIVRYTWTQTGIGEDRPRVEAEFSGRTGAARGLAKSNLTELLAIRAQPFVLGHYLMTVTPREVRGQAPLGSTSNGQVFRCAFGSENLPPATDGMLADSFTPIVDQAITVSPFAIDPETGQSVYDNQIYDFGDGTVLTGVSGAATHAYAKPGIYSLRCTVADAPDGLGVSRSATAQDNVIVLPSGALPLEKLNFKFFKSIVPEEAGSGEPNKDTITAVFKGAIAKGGDRIVFVYNRNRFGRMDEMEPIVVDGVEQPGDESDDIVLGPGGGFSTQKNRKAQSLSVRAGPQSLSISISGAQLDRTGDPRLGRSDFKGIFGKQRIAVCIVPQDGSDPQVLLYSGNIEARLKGGGSNRFVFAPEESIKGAATTKEPNFNKQERPE